MNDMRTMCLQVRKEEYELPGLRFPPSVPDCAPAADIVAYLEDFCSKFQLEPHFKFKCPVLRISRCKESTLTAATVADALTKPAQRFEIEYRAQDGSVQSEQFTFVILCQGNTSGELIKPRFPNEEVFQGKILHSSEVRNMEQLRKKKVLVLGSGKSALDAVANSAEVAASTTQVHTGNSGSACCCSSAANHALPSTLYPASLRQHLH